MERLKGLLGWWILVGLVTWPLMGQGPSDKAVSMKGVVFKGRAPVNKEILRVKLPHPHERRLSNGLTVLILEDHKLPTVGFQLLIKTGALSDPQELPGLARFVAALLREGTRHRTSEQMAEEVDNIGAMLEAGAAFGSSNSRITASGLVENIDKILDLLSDMVTDPTFPTEELDKFKNRELANLRQQRSFPNFLAREKFHRVVYGEFPAAQISSTRDSVDRATTKHLKEFHSTYYRPNNALLGVVGAVTPESLMPLVEKYFEGWLRARVPLTKLPRLPPAQPKTIHLLDRPGSVQTSFYAGNLSLSRPDPDYIPFSVMNRVLGSGPSSRLFLNLREDKGYTYGAYTRFRPDIYPGPWAAVTDVRSEVTGPALGELMAEFRRIREELVPESELDDARRSFIAAFALELERPDVVLGHWLNVKYHGLSEDYWDRYPEAVVAVDTKLIQEIARKYVDLDHMQIVAVGDSGKIKEQLEEFGRVISYDSEGKRLGKK